MRILITGVTGFIGGHLVEHLGAVGGHELFGVGRQAAFSREWSHLNGRMNLHKVELSDTTALAALLKDIQPQGVFHLAGYSNPRDANRNPESCWADNFGGTQSLYSAIQASGVRPRILFASTGHVYGSTTQAHEICDENTPLNPRGPYAESKQAAEELSRKLAEEPGLNIVRVRLFNQIGPRQSKGFIVSDYASQIAEVEAGRRAAVETGDLSGWRDFTDVRDVVVALRLLMETPHDVRGEVFNAASGRMWQLEDIVNRLLGLASVKIVIEKPHDVPIAPFTFAKIDSRKLYESTDWQPRIELKQTLQDTLEYWRAAVKNSPPV